MDKEQLAIARLQDAARLSEHRYKKPLMVTYSGGKDSQVLVALAERAGINFEVVNSHTTADAPETVYFIRKQFKAMEEQCTFQRLNECLMSENQKVCRATGRPAWTCSAGGWKMKTSAVS